MALTPEEEFELLSLERERAMTQENHSSIPQKSRFRKFYDMASVPSKMAESGINQLADFIPEPPPVTGNLPADLAMGAPSILTKAGIKATGKVAAANISPEAIAMSMGANTLGLLAKPIGAVAKGLASQAEDVSGIAPRAAGALAETFKDPTLLFAKSKKAAGPLYEAAKNEIPRGANLFKGMYKPEKIVDAAQEVLNKGGKLEPAEALMARKATDALMRSKRYVKDELVDLRETFDFFAKASDNIKKADPIFKRGIMAEAMRNFLPQNKGGGVSPFKIAEGMAMTKFIPGGKYIAAPLLMPIVQGAIAAGAGTVAKPIGMGVKALQSPAGAGAIKALMQALSSRRKKQ